MRRSFKRSIKAVSPVIATIIIVAVAIVMSIAVAYWMLGLATTFTRYEKLEFTAAYATISGTKYTVTLELKNTGTTTATIDRVLLNGIPLNNSIKVDINPATKSVSPGGSCTINIELPKDTIVNGAKMTSGISVEIIVTTAAGNQYPKTIVLP